MYGDQAMLIIEPYTTLEKNDNSTSVLNNTQSHALMWIKDALNLYKPVITKILRLNRS